MFNNPLFDTAIALITLYLLFSQLTLSLVELLAGALNTRGRYLYKQLRLALGQEMHARFYTAATISSWSLPRSQKSPALRRWVPLWPAYISETLFAQTIVAAVIGPTPDAGQLPIAQFGAGLAALPGPTPTDGPEADFKGTLLTLYTAALSVGATPAEQGRALEDNIAGWFRGFGDRLTGRYKRDNRKYLFWVGLLVALLADVDSVRLARFLADSNNAAARAGLVTLGVQAAQQARPDPRDYDLKDPVQAAEYKKREREWSALLKAADAELKSTLAAVGKLGLPLGFLRWTNYLDTVKTKAIPPYQWAPSADDYQMPEYAQRHVLDFATGGVTDAPHWHWTHMVGGWLLTAFALMLGAPFWFDTLRHFVNIRNVGPPPAPAGGHS
jgi:hypothetical protein